MVRAYSRIVTLPALLAIEFRVVAGLGHLSLCVRTEAESQNTGRSVGYALPAFRNRDGTMRADFMENVRRFIKRKCPEGGARERSVDNLRKLPAMDRPRGVRIADIAGINRTDDRGHQPDPISVDSSARDLSHLVHHLFRQ